jgi:hypothetical protein
VLIVHGMELDYWMYITGRGSGCTSAVAGGVMNCSTATDAIQTVQMITNSTGLSDQVKVTLLFTNNNNELECLTLAHTAKPIDPFGSGRFGSIIITSASAYNGTSVALHTNCASSAMITFKCTRRIDYSFWCRNAELRISNLELDMNSTALVDLLEHDDSYVVIHVFNSSITFQGISNSRLILSYGANINLKLTSSLFKRVAYFGSEYDGFNVEIYDCEFIGGKQHFSFFGGTVRNSKFLNVASIGTGTEVTFENCIVSYTDSEWIAFPRIGDYFVFGSYGFLSLHNVTVITNGFINYSIFILFDYGIHIETKSTFRNLTINGVRDAPIFAFKYLDYYDLTYNEHSLISIEDSAIQNCTNTSMFLFFCDYDNNFSTIIRILKTILFKFH